VNIILGACMQARHFIEALRKGDRFQVTRALSLQAAQIAVTGKPVTKREQSLVALGRSLAAREEGPDALVYVDGRWGISCYIRGMWKEAQTALSRGLEVSNGGDPSSLALGRLFLARTYYFLGDLQENIRRETRLYAAAEDRGDLNMTVNMRTSTYIRKWLAQDDPDRARRDVRDALAEWSQKGFLVQHWQAMVFAPDIDLYVGDGATAYERFARDLPALKRSLLLHSGYIRAVTLCTRGRLAIASIESKPSPRSARIHEARRCARALRRELTPWSAMLASMVDAVVENASGHREAAIAALRDAIERALRTDTLCYVEPLRHRLGELLGGDEGRALMEHAVEAIAAQGVRDPRRWVAMNLPGTWGVAPTAGPRPDDGGARSIAT
jgi:hypothetical protein